MSSIEAQIPIRTLSALTGVNPVTLRAWERRYGLLRPLRSDKGHRLYTHTHVDQIRRVLALLDRGVPVGRVRELLEAEAATAAGSSGPWPDSFAPNGPCGSGSSSRYEMISGISAEVGVLYSSIEGNLCTTLRLPR